MRAIFPTLLLFLATALPAWSQWHSSDPTDLFERFPTGMYQSPVDSADFTRFGAAVARTDMDIGPLPDQREYRLIWAMQCEGMTTLERGNGTDLVTFLKDPPEKRFGEIVCCPRFHGGRYAVVHWEPPTGLVRYRYWFFERK